MRECLDALQRCGRRVRLSLRFCRSTDHANKRHESSYRCWPCLSTLTRPLSSTTPTSIDSRIVRRTVLALSHTSLRYSKRSLSPALLATARTNNRVSFSSFLLFARRFTRSVSLVAPSVFFISERLTLHYRRALVRNPSQLQAFHPSHLLFIEQGAGIWSKESNNSGRGGSDSFLSEACHLYVFYHINSK